MIPVGYMAKRVVVSPDWIKAPRVRDIYSVSSCVSRDFANYINYWKHNGYWFFDSPEVIQRVARENSMDLSGTTLFFYEVHDLQWDGERWVTFTPERSFATNVLRPGEMVLEGFDVVTFYVQTSAECSPLSCNGLAAEVDTNEHCLLSSFERAQVLLEQGRFADTEPGPYRIFAVYSTGWPA